MQSKSRAIGYWLSTALVAFSNLSGGAFDLMRSPKVMEGMAHLGYAPYVASILGVWKVLGAIAIALPKFPRLKEWAYAGIFFDLTGAAVSHAVSGDPAPNVVTPLVLAAISMTSWALRPDSRRLTPAT